LHLGELERFEIEIPDIPQIGAFIASDDVYSVVGGDTGLAPSWLRLAVASKVGTWAVNASFELINV